MPRKRPAKTDTQSRSRAERFAWVGERFREVEAEAGEHPGNGGEWSHKVQEAVSKRMAMRDETTKTLTGLVAKPEAQDDSLEARMKRAIAGSMKSLDRLARAGAEQEAKREKKKQALKNLEGSKDPAEVAPVKKLFGVWKGLMAKHFPDIRYAPWWDQKGGKSKPTKEAGMAGTFVRGYGLDLASATLEYVFNNWEKFGARFKQRPEVPTLGWIVSLASTLTAEVQTAKPGTQSAEQKVQAAKAALDKWFADNPSESMPPDELRAALTAAKKELEAQKGGKK